MNTMEVQKNWAKRDMPQNKRLSEVQSNDLLCFLNTQRDWALSNKIEELRDLKEDAAMWSSGYQSAIESVLKYIEKHNAEVSRER
jgi:tryptophan 2,3-dioxygenase